MNFTINFPLFNAAATVAALLAWGVMIFFAYRIYKKQRVKPKVWKIAGVLLVGFLSISFDVSILGTVVKLSIFPLGVGILYYLLNKNKEKWQTYRSFAWLGFLANFIFLLFALLSIPVHQALYPVNEPSTYLANVEDASLIAIHPTAKESGLHIESLKKQLPLLKQRPNRINEWYYEHREAKERMERFPYLLTGTLPKWGSGMNPLIFVGGDGKGILVSTPNKQIYFRSEESLLEGAVK
ncbi:hypothetical protein [Bacillus sp. SJS]|uniref:hypothetical protein n=1 Tax=Bacillus sp. SJS TaxID=1423321 RepID=UPI0004DD65F7|nr:hypothetical protein [Bacillus sp. SJS]KZZ84353.1 hypothetical protein AS29_010850 [Bacillus sp. SJS]